MRIERRYTKRDQSPYAAIEFRADDERDPESRRLVVFRLENVEVPEFWSQVASDVLAQKYFRKAGVARALKKVEEKPSPPGSGARSPTPKPFPLLPEAERIRRRTFSQAGVRPSRRLLDLLGLEGRLLLRRRRRHAPSSTNCASCWRSRWSRRTPRSGSTPACTGPTASMVPSQGHYYVDFKTGKLTKSKSSYEHPQPHACFIQGVERRPRQRGRHHGPVGPRGAPVQIRLRHRLQLLAPARRRREAVGRRPLLRPHELPQDRRPRGGRHQVRRHHAPRGQDGRRRRRPSGYRDLYRLEGEGRAEGRGARHRLQASTRST
jgi:hypothetical protein